MVQSYEALKEVLTRKPRPIEMAIAFLVLLLMVILSSCSEKPHRSGLFPPDAFCEGDDSEQSRRTKKHMNERGVEELGTLFSTTGEPSLYELSNDRRAESYRFTWLRSFHRKMVFRVTANRYSGGMLIVKAVDEPGLKNQKLNESRPLQISEAELAKLRQLVATSRRLEKLLCYQLLGLDGSVWVLEIVDKGQYRIVTRQGDDSVEFRSALQYVIELADSKQEQFY